MPRPPDIVNAVRATGYGLVVFAVLFGPAGLGPASTFASTGACSRSCPCEEEEAVAGQHEAADASSDPDGRETEGCDHDEGAAHAEGDACRDECPTDDCPDDCPNCNCSPGLAAAVMPSDVRTSTAPSTAAHRVEASGRPANGSVGRVFRPPRSLT